MVADRQTVLDVLGGAFARKHNSLAAYIVAAAPFVASGREELMAAIAAAAAEDEKSADELAAAIEDLEGVPAAGPYDWRVSELNYLAIEYLKEVLASDLEKQLADFARDALRLDGWPAAQALMARLASAARTQLVRLVAR